MTGDREITGFLKAHSKVLCNESTTLLENEEIEWVFVERTYASKEEYTTGKSELQNNKIDTNSERD